MAITSNINQSSLTGLRELTARQQQDSNREDSQKHAAGESEKAREGALKLYSLQAGDTFKKNNKEEILSDKVKGSFGEHIFSEYERANNDFEEARRLMNTGNNEDRRKGQALISRSNSYLKTLASEYTEMEVELAAYVNDPELLNSNSGDELKAIQLAQIEGKLDIVSSMTAGKEEGSNKRYLRWKDEEGEDQFRSYDWVTNAIKGGVTRVDTAAWQEKFQKVTATSKLINKDGTFQTEEIKESMLDTWVDDLIGGNEGKNMSALIQQFDLMGDKDAPGKVETKLKELLRATLPNDSSKEKASVGGSTKVTASDKKEDRLAQAMSHRKYQVNRITAVNEDGSPTDDALDFLEQTLSSHTNIGDNTDFKGQSVTSVKYDKGSNKVSITYGNGKVKTEVINPSSAFNLISLHSVARDQEQLDMSSTLGSGTVAQAAFKDDIKKSGVDNVRIDRAFENIGTDKKSIRDAVTKLFDDVDLPVSMRSAGGIFNIGADKIKLGDKEYELTEEALPVLIDAVKDFIATHQGTGSKNESANNVPSGGELD
jgi:hypothetical protein